MKQLAVVALALAACGGGSGGDAEFGPAADAVVGIYSVDALTRNEDACAADGVTLGTTHQFAVAFRQAFFGVQLLTVMSCESPTLCRETATGETFGAIDFSFGAEQAGDNGELIGGGGSTGFDINGTCTEGEVFDTVLTLTGDQLRIEKSITVADDYPADSEGFCTTELAREAAAGNSCSIMEVLTATFVEAL